MKLTKKILKKSLLSVLVMLMTFSVFTNATQAISIGGGGGVNVKDLEYTITINKVNAAGNAIETAESALLVGTAQTYTYNQKAQITSGTDKYAYKGYYVVDKTGNPYVGSPTDLQKRPEKPAVTTKADASDTVSGVGSYSIYVVYGLNENGDENQTNVIPDDEETYNITEKYVDKNGVTISADTTKVINGVRYTGTPTGVSSYVYKGYYVTSADGDNRQSLASPIAGNPTNLLLGQKSADGKDDYVVTFVYEKSTIAIEVIYDGNGGTGTMANTSSTTSAQTTLRINMFVNPGYSFSGWATTPNGAKKYNDREKVTFTDSDLVETNKVKLYALWTKDSNQWATITFDGNGANSGTMPNQEVVKNINTNLNKNNFTKTGYIFKGWSTTLNGAVTYLDEGSIKTSGNVTLYAVWEEANVVIVFKSGDADATGEMANQTIMVNTATNLSKNEFVKPGYSFNGWSTTAGGTRLYTDEQSVTLNTGDNKTLYALWVKDDNQWSTISYNANGGTGTMESKEVLRGTPTTLATNAFTAPADSIFLGWSTTQTGGVEYQDGATITPTQRNTTLYAVWGSLMYNLSDDGFEVAGNHVLGDVIARRITLEVLDNPKSAVFGDVVLFITFNPDEFSEIENLRITKNGEVVSLNMNYNAALGLAFFEIGDINPGETYEVTYEQTILQPGGRLLSAYDFDITIKK